MDELNPKLFAALEKRFGKVLISNPGERLVERKIPDPVRPGRHKQLILRSGEYYRVDCPYCSDKRGRLYINYRWNTRTRNGDRFGRFLAVCFNEGCDLSGLDMELGALAKNWPVVDRPYTNKPDSGPEFAPQVMPGVCLPLDTLPPEHEACKYVREKRGFDPVELGRMWGVSYCVHCGVTDKTPYPGLVRGRLVIPIWRSGVLVGWQTRALNEHDSPKYYTMPGFPKSRMLFNQDRAQQYRFGVVVEGVFDAFRVGDRAVALFGKSMSQTQRELAVAYWGQGALCIVLDDDATEDMDRLSQVMDPMKFKDGSFIVRLPIGKDPGNMDRDELWRLIASNARNHGVRLA